MRTSLGSRKERMVEEWLRFLPTVAVEPSANESSHLASRASFVIEWNERSDPLYAAKYTAMARHLLLSSRSELDTGAVHLPEIRPDARPYAERDRDTGARSYEKKEPAHACVDANAHTLPPAFGSACARARTRERRKEKVALGLIVKRISICEWNGERIILLFSSRIIYVAEYCVETL